MDRTPVSSSSIAAVGYDAPSQTLEIEFRNGGTYQYYEVSRAVVDEFLDASSLGRYFQAEIRGAYRYERI